MSEKHLRWVIIAAWTIIVFAAVCVSFAYSQDTAAGPTIEVTKEYWIIHKARVDKAKDELEAQYRFWEQQSRQAAAEIARFEAMEKKKAEEAVTDSSKPPPETDSAAR